MRLAASRDEAIPGVEDSPGVDQFLEWNRGLSNDTCANAVSIGLGSVVGTTVGASNDWSSPCAASSSSPDVWFRFDATRYGALLFDTKGSEYDTVVTVYRDACPANGGYEFVCADDGLGTASAGVFDTYQGSTYFLRVSGYNGAAGGFRLALAESSVVRGSVTSTDPAWVPNGRVRLLKPDGYGASQGAIEPSGEYAIAVTQVGELVAVTDVDGALNEVHEDIPCDPDCDLSQGTRILVGADTESVVDFELDAGASITGVVRDGVTNDPIAGVRVTAWADSSYSYDRTYTDATGSYRIGALLPESYSVVAELSPYIPEFYGGSWCTDEYYCETGGVRVVVAGTEEQTDIDFELDRQAVISGTVTDESTGLPIADAWVSAWADYLDRSTSTDDAGNYSIGLLPGRYRVSFGTSRHIAEIYDDIEMPSQWSGGAPGDLIEVDANSSVTGIDAAMAPYARVRGVVELDGVGVGGVDIRVYNDRDNWFGYTSYTDGSYEVIVREPGSYWIAVLPGYSSSFVAQHWPGKFCSGQADCPAESDQVEIAKGQLLDEIDFDLFEASSISGRIEDSVGTAIYDARVTVYRDGEVVTSQSAYSGNYEVSLIEGTYKLVGSAPGYSSQVFQEVDCGLECDLSAGSPIPLAREAMVGDVNFSLQKLGSISGTVRDSDGALLGADVYAVGEGGEVTRANRTGSGFEVLGLQPGQYWLYTRARYSGDGFIDEVWPDVPCETICVPSLGTPVSIVGREQVTGIDFILARRGRFQASVREVGVGDFGGRAYVDVLDSVGNYVDSFSVYGSGSGWSDRLPAGDYHLRASADGYARIAYPDLTCVPFDSSCLGDPVSLNDNSEVSVEFSLPRAGSMSGTVRADSGAPLSTWVRLYSAASSLEPYSYGNFVSVRAETGVFRFDGLQPGTYYALTVDTLGHVDESYADIPCVYEPPRGCTPAKGTPIEVLPDRETRHVSFSLRSLGGSGELPDYGVVVDSDGFPLAGALVDIWNPAGAHVASVFVDGGGVFALDLPAGDYHFSSDAGPLYLDMIYGGDSCPGSSAYEGGCDPLSGQLVTIDSSDGVEAVVLFRLSRESLFEDGFESGDMTAWSLP